MVENTDEKEKVLDNSHVLTLAEMEVGETCRILSLPVSNQDRAGKLLVLGLYPGLQVSLLQRFPSTVVQVGHTWLALDQETAREIAVIREAGSGGRRYRRRRRCGFWRMLLTDLSLIVYE